MGDGNRSVPICHTALMRSSRTSMRRRCRFTMTSTIRRTWTRRTPRSRTEWADKPAQGGPELFLAAAGQAGPVRNNAGGHANHSLFWTILGPNGGGTPSGELGSAIDSTFGGFDALKKQLIDAGVNRFGSGWSWLVVSNGDLEGHVHREPGLADLGRRHADPRDRRLGARVLPELPEPPARLPRGDLQRHRLVGRRGALHRRPLGRRHGVAVVILRATLGSDPDVARRRRRRRAGGHALASGRGVRARRTTASGSATSCAPAAAGRLHRRGVVRRHAGRARLRRGAGTTLSAPPEPDPTRRPGRRAVLEGLHPRHGADLPQAHDRAAGRRSCSRPGRR